MTTFSARQEGNSAGLTQTIIENIIDKMMEKAFDKGYDIGIKHGVKLSKSSEIIRSSIEMDVEVNKLKQICFSEIYESIIK